MKPHNDYRPTPCTSGPAEPAAQPAAPPGERGDKTRDPWASASAPEDLEARAREPRTTAEGGTCYLLHFAARDGQDAASRLLQVANAAGITWTLARTWPGGRTRERQPKTRAAHHPMPACGVKPRSTQASERRPSA